MSAAVKRACDACHRRKVKCDGINPCRNCSSAQLSCTYNAIPQKKGPKGSRAKVISELRETQRQTSLSAKIHNTLMNSSPEGPPPQSMSLKGTPGLLSMETIKTAIDFYFDHLYSIAPILDRQSVIPQATYMEQNQSMDTYCLFSSLAAYTMIQPGAPLPGGDNGFNLASMPGAHLAATQILVDETVRVRKGLDYMTNPTFNSLCTSYFLFAANYSLEYHDQAWFHLREATTIMLMHKMHMEETYVNYGTVEASRRRRLFWLFFAAERIYALKHGDARPLSLQPTINLPTPNDDPSDPLGHQLGDFLSQTTLMSTFDHTFMQQWNKIRGEFDACTLQNLTSQFSKVAPSMSNLANPLEDLLPNQNWLKNIDWRLRYQNGSLSPDDQEANMAIRFGRDYSADIVSMQSHFGTPNTGVIDIGMIAKLFNLSYSLTEHLKTRPQSRNPLSKGLREHLHDLLSILSVLRNGDHRFLPNLVCKLHGMLQKLPSPKLEEVPEALAQNLGAIDIFDGFGSMGMAPMDFAAEEKKYMPDINTSMGMGGGGGGGGGPSVSMGDMTSPFSPAIMSPGGMEFPQTLQDFNTPMEMAMSPVGPGPVQNMQSISPVMMNQQQQQQQHQQPQSSQPQGQQPLPPAPPLTPIHQSMSSQQMQSMNPQMGMGTAGLGMMSNQMMGRPPQQPPQPQQQQQHQHQTQTPQPQRSNTFAVPPVPRTVADFQALQRVKTEPQVPPHLAPSPPQQQQQQQPGGGVRPATGCQNMNSQLAMSMTEIDFSNLR